MDRMMILSRWVNTRLQWTCAHAENFDRKIMHKSHPMSWLVVTQWAAVVSCRRSSRRQVLARHNPSLTSSAARNSTTTPTTCCCYCAETSHSQRCADTWRHSVIFQRPSCAVWSGHCWIVHQQSFYIVWTVLCCVLQLLWADTLGLCF